MMAHDEAMEGIRRSFSGSGGDDPSCVFRLQGTKGARGK